MRIQRVVDGRGRHHFVQLANNLSKISSATNTQPKRVVLPLDILFAFFSYHKVFIYH